MFCHSPRTIEIRSDIQNSRALLNSKRHSESFDDSELVVRLRHFQRVMLFSNFDFKFL